MHRLFEQADRLSREAIGASIEVHRDKGSGLIESIYEKCLMRELRFYLLVEGCLLLELKCIQEILPIHKAQLLSYMKLLNVPVGLIINFHEQKLTDGVFRMILPGANR